MVEHSFTQLAIRVSSRFPRLGMILNNSMWVNREMGDSVVRIPRNLWVLMGKCRTDRGYCRLFRSWLRLKPSNKDKKGLERTQADFLINNSLAPYHSTTSKACRIRRLLIWISPDMLYKQRRMRPEQIHLKSFPPSAIRTTSLSTPFSHLRQRIRSNDLPTWAPVPTTPFVDPLLSQASDQALLHCMRLHRSTRPSPGRKAKRAQQWRWRPSYRVKNRHLQNWVVANKGKEMSFKIHSK